MLTRPAPFGAGRAFCGCWGGKSDRVAGVEALADVLVAVFGAAGAGVCAVHPLPADRDMASRPHDRLISELLTGVRRRPSVFGAAAPRLFACAAPAADKKRLPRGTHPRGRERSGCRLPVSSRRGRRGARPLPWPCAPCAPAAGQPQHRRALPAAPMQSRDQTAAACAGTPAAHRSRQACTARS